VSRSQYCANHLNADPAYVPLQFQKNKNRSPNKRQATIRETGESEKCQTTIEEEIGKEKKTELSRDMVSETTCVTNKPAIASCALPELL
jgi:hypothetical protein